MEHQLTSSRYILSATEHNGKKEMMSIFYTSHIEGEVLGKFHLKNSVEDLWTQPKPPSTHVVHYFLKKCLWEKKFLCNP